MEGLTAVGVGIIVLGVVILIIAVRKRQTSLDYEDRQQHSENQQHYEDQQQPTSRQATPPPPVPPPTKVAPTEPPQRVTFFDVETTGLGDNDRIVTLAAIRLLNPETCAAQLEAEFLHLVFDPGRKSHPKAEAVHGYSDWVLRHQDPFDVHAETIQKFFNSSDVLVAHNAEFDLAFYAREMERTGRLAFANKTFCTMTAYRQLGIPGSASLDAACQRMGLARMGNSHGALEDAWLALRVYLWLKKVPFSASLPAEFQDGPSNLKPIPPPPDGPLPRRRGLSSRPWRRGDGQHAHFRS
jgi:DNA polymerase-3 subunit epsilon